MFVNHLLNKQKKHPDGAAKTQSIKDKKVSTLIKTSMTRENAAMTTGSRGCYNKKMHPDGKAVKT